MAFLEPKDYDEKHTEALLKGDYIVAFGSKCGPAQERVLRDLYDFCGMFQTSFVAGDPYATAFQEGARAVVLRILDFAHGSGGAPIKVQEIESDKAQERM